MKRKNSIINVFLTMAVMFTALFFNSCSKEDSIKTEEKDDFGKYTKELTIFDKNKENSAILKIGSNDESILNMWTADNFELVPIKHGQTLADVMNATEDNGEEEISDESSDDEDIVAAEMSTMFISKNLKDGVRNVALTTKPPYDEDMRGWSYDTHYSEAINNNTVTVNIYGHNRWRRGYWKASYKKRQSSGWSTIQGGWTKIRKGQSVSKTRTPCYKMKARRKYKKGSVTIEFED